MLRVTIHGNPASYSTADGWRCNDGLVERYLRSVGSTDDQPMSEEQALALAVREYGSAVVLDEPDTLDGHADDDAHPLSVPSTPASDCTFDELELPPPDSTRTERVRGFLAKRRESSS